MNLIRQLLHKAPPPQITLQDPEFPAIRREVEKVKREAFRVEVAARLALREMQ